MGGNITKNISLAVAKSEDAKRAFLKGLAEYLKVEVPAPIKPTAPGVNTEIYVFASNGTKASVFYNPDNGKPMADVLIDTNDSNLEKKVYEMIKNENHP